jgi:hypothetical protein
MEDKKTKIKFALVVALAWLVSIALAYLAFIKIRFLI